MQEIADELKRAGKVRAFGLATWPDETLAILGAAEFPVQVVQFADDLFKRAARRLPAGRTLGVIKHSVFQFDLARVDPKAVAAMRPLLIEARIDPAEPNNWRELSLAHACFTNPNGVVVCSMFNPRHIELNAAIASGSRFPPALVAALDAAW